METTVNSQGCLVKFSNGVVIYLDDSSPVPSLTITTPESIVSRHSDMGTTPGLDIITFFPKVGMTV